MKDRFIKWIAVVLTLLLATACIEDGELSIYLIKTSDLGRDPLTPELTSHVRVRVTGPGMKPKVRVTPYKAGGATSVPKVPQGEDRIITVEGLYSENGIAMSRGRTLPMDIDDGRQSVNLFIARVDRISVAPNNGLPLPRFGHAVMSDPTDRLFVVGGASKGDVTVPESFRNTPTVIAPTDIAVEDLDCKDSCRTTPRVFGTAAPYKSGFLFFGGVGEAGALVDEVDYVNMTAGTVSRSDISMTPRSEAASIIFDDKTVVAGGLDGEGNPVDTMEIIDREGKVTTRTLPDGRYAMAAGRAGRKGLFFGGFTASGEISADLYVFDADNDTLSALSADIKGRAYASAVTTVDDRLLIIGGLSDEGRATGEINLYDPAVGAICLVGYVSIARWHAAVAPLPNGRVVVIGGLTGMLPGQPTTDVMVFDPRFKNINADCEGISLTSLSGGGEHTGSPRFLSSAVLMANGNVAVIGGLGGNREALQQIEVYVPPED